MALVASSVLIARQGGSHDDDVVFGGIRMNGQDLGLEGDLALGVGSDKRRTPTPSKADCERTGCDPDEGRTSDI